MASRRRLALLLLASAVPALTTHAQTTYTLSPSGAWAAAAAPEPAPEAAPIQEARALLADNRPERAKSILDDFIEAHQTAGNPLLAQAFLLRGDAITAAGNEFDGLYDYEEVCRSYAGSEEFLKALERELDIGTRYLHGLKRKWLWMRLTDSEDIGEELLVRIQERLPGSRMAETAALALADYYYQKADLKIAADAYEVFARNFPRSPHATLARERRIYANIARFQGPNYDASGLTDARVLIEEFSRDDPAGARRAGLSDALLARLDESGAQQFLEKARWYFRRGDTVSARYILQRLVETHPQTVAARNGLKIMDQYGWSVRPPPPPPPTPGEATASPPADGAAPAAPSSTTPPAPPRPPPPAPAEPNK